MSCFLVFSGVIQTFPPSSSDTFDDLRTDKGCNKLTDLRPESNFDHAPLTEKLVKYRVDCAVPADRIRINGDVYRFDFLSRRL